MSKALHSQFDCAEGCSVEAALAVIGGKWKGTILYRLFVDEVLRFNEIRRILPEVPPRVEYRLTAYGQTLQEVVWALKSWGDTHQLRPSEIKPSSK